MGIEGPNTCLIVETLGWSDEARPIDPLVLAKPYALHCGGIGLDLHGHISFLKGVGSRVIILQGTGRAFQKMRNFFYGTLLI